MFRFWFALTAIVASVSCGSSTPVAPTPSTNPTTDPLPSTAPTTAVLSGTVGNQAGAKLAGATVEVTSGSGSGQNATTDGNGAYRFDTLPVGSATLVAKAKGYFDSMPETVTVDGTNTLGFTLSPMPATTARLIGVVATPGRTPLSGAVVTVLDGIAAGQKAATDINGQYSFPELPTGPTNLIARLAGYTDEPGTVSVNGTNALTFRMHRILSTVTDTFMGSIGPGNQKCVFMPGSIHDNKPCLNHVFEVTNSGTLSATLTWTGSSDLDLGLWIEGTLITETTNVGKPEVLSTTIEPGRITVTVYYYSGSVIENYSLTVTHPN